MEQNNKEDTIGQRYVRFGLLIQREVWFLSALSYKRKRAALCLKLTELPLIARKT